MKSAWYRVSPASFPLILGGKRIPPTHGDVFLRITLLPTGQYLSQYYEDIECKILLHENKSRGC